jgi:hypothetical protein
MAPAAQTLRNPARPQRWYRYIVSTIDTRLQRRKRWRSRLWKIKVDIQSRLGHVFSQQRRPSTDSQSSCETGLRPTMSITVSFASTKSSATARSKQKRDARNEFGILPPPSQPTRTKRTSRRRTLAHTPPFPAAVRRSQREPSPRPTFPKRPLVSSSSEIFLSFTIADKDKSSFLVWSATPAARLVSRCYDVMHGLRKADKSTPGMGTSTRVDLTSYAAILTF